jgi:pyrroline-5-carboxylate reductase
MKIICIGSGNMGCALMAAAANACGGSNIGFTDIERSKAENTAKSLGGFVCDSNVGAAAQADFLFLAVKPATFAAVLQEIAPVVKERLAKGDALTLVSMAAGWSIKKIKDALGVANAPVVRLMPNTPALVGEGVVAFSPSAEVSEQKILELEKILAKAGLVNRIDEHYLNAVTALSGSGPAYVCLFIEALADGGVNAGLPRETALKYAAQTVLGSASMILKTGEHPAKLKDMVCSPAGTTIAAINALENSGFRAAAMNAVAAAFRRAKELE